MKHIKGQVCVTNPATEMGGQEHRKAFSSDLHEATAPPSPRMDAPYPTKF